MQKKARWFWLLHIILGIYAIGGVCSKLAAKQAVLSLPFLLLYGGVLVTLVVYAIGWQQVIKHLPLTTAYANKAVTVIWGIVFGFLIFGEQVSPKQMLGAAVIIIGVVLYVRADGETEHE